jgi:amidase
MASRDGPAVHPKARGVADLSLVPPATDQLVTLGAGELARRIAAGEVSAVQACAAALDRIAAVEPLIHAFACLEPEGVMAAARRADEHQASGAPLGLLHGVPVSIKDWIEVEGLVCDAGFEGRQTFRPARDATVAARLKGAGAIVLGKTAVNDGQPFHPQPRNPHDLNRSPGASSSGEAALIAAFGSPLGLGSDSGGSIRIPAHHTGLAGLKPTHGRVPVTGHFPPIGALSDPRTVIGPLARRVEDLALALSIIAGPDGQDPAVALAPLGAVRDVAVRTARVAVVDFGERGLTEAARAALGAAAEALKAAGVDAREAELPILQESLEITEAYWTRLWSFSLHRWRPHRTSRLSADALEESIFRWERLQRRVEAFMQDYDAILCPTAAGPAPAIRPLTGADFLFTLPFSLTGQPAVAVPVGRSEEGLPLGVQVAARRWRDDVALAIAKVIEDQLRANR